MRVFLFGVKIHAFFLMNKDRILLWSYDKPTDMCNVDKTDKKILVNHIGDNMISFILNIDLI